MLIRSQIPPSQPHVKDLLSLFPETDPVTQSPPQKALQHFTPATYPRHFFAQYCFFLIAERDDDKKRICSFVSPPLGMEVPSNEARIAELGTGEEMRREWEEAQGEG